MAQPPSILVCQLLCLPTHKKRRHLLCFVKAEGLSAHKVFGAGLFDISSLPTFRETCMGQNPVNPFPPNGIPPKTLVPQRMNYGQESRIC